MRVEIEYAEYIDKNGFGHISQRCESRNIHNVDDNDKKFLKVTSRRDVRVEIYYQRGTGRGRHTSHLAEM